jgi:hypothetical protein
LNCLVNIIERPSLPPPLFFMREGGGHSAIYFPAGTNLELVPGIVGLTHFIFPRSVVVVAVSPTHPTSRCVYHSLLIY